MHDDADATAVNIVAAFLSDACGTFCSLSKNVYSSGGVDYFIHTDKNVVAHEQLTDEAIVSSVREMDNNEDKGASFKGKMTNTRTVLNAFDAIRTSLRMHDDDIVVDYFLRCEGTSMRSLHGKDCQGKLREFWHSFCVLLTIFPFVLCYSVVTIFLGFLTNFVIVGFNCNGKRWNYDVIV